MFQHILNISDDKSRRKLIVSLTDATVAALATFMIYKLAIYIDDLTVIDGVLSAATMADCFIIAGLVFVLAVIGIFVFGRFDDNARRSVRRTTYVAVMALLAFPTVIWLGLGLDGDSALRLSNWLSLVAPFGVPAAAIGVRALGYHVDKSQ